ncbi:MAG TPA: glycosyltransferase, partial [Vicinamibacterales bacterium]|nr:glycosyltransferase [Vicinamibacterales bacterium]
VVPAAGLGSRLGADRPKLLVPVAGRPMLDHLVELYRPYVSLFVLVIAPAARQLVSRHLAGRSERFALVEQPSPTGMLDAILLAAPVVQETDAVRVWITWADQIAIHPQTARRLAEESDRGAPLVLPTLKRRKPYTRLERDASGRIVAVRQSREGDAMPEEGESEVGLFSLSRGAFLEDLPAYAAAADRGAVTGERNFLPFIPWLAARGEVRTFPCVEDIEAVGINTPGELRAVEAALQRRSKGIRTLSIVIPAYNEERFIGTLLDQIEAVDLTPLGFTKELIVVDDCSTDATPDIVRAHEGVRLHRMPRNGGKGRAVRAGIELATGEHLLIQDADLEYDPRDYAAMLQPIVEGRADIVYGSRYLGRYAPWPHQSWAAYLGGRSLSLVAWLWTGRYLTDTVTALKLFPREPLASLPLETSGFELDHEITARMVARGLRIVEVPIRYYPRSRAEGKKIGLRDWFVATRTFFKYRHG